MSKIPKIFHFTCQNKNSIPEIYKDLLFRLKSLHPDWEIYVHDDNDLRKILSASMYELLPVFDSYILKIQQLDLFRVLVVYLYGGFYLDMDIRCYKNLNNLLNHGVVIGEEFTLDSSNISKSENRSGMQIANYMFGGIPEHPFFLDLLISMILRSQNEIHTEEDVIQSTGPGVFTYNYFKVKSNYTDIHLLENNNLKCFNRWCNRISCHFGEYAIHLHLGTWRWSSRGLPFPAKRSKKLKMKMLYTIIRKVQKYKSIN